MKRLFEEFFGRRSTEDSTDGTGRTLDAERPLQDDPRTDDDEAISKANERVSPLREPQEFTRLSGTEFEYYMANLFRALGYDAKRLGGAGDQGVDLLLRKEHELVAVQCKNYKDRIGNKPVQEVFAGARHRGAHRAWVVAPAGFTRGARELARSTGVRLFDRTHIEKWLRHIDSRRRIRACQKDADREDYQMLIEVYSRMLDSLERRYDAQHRCAPEVAYGPKVKDRYDQAHHTTYEYIKSLRRDLGILASRHPEFATDELVDVQAELGTRQQKIELWAKERGVAFEPASLEDRSSAPTREQIPRSAVSTSGPSGSVPPNRSDSVVGDTRTSKSGDRLTLRSYGFQDKKDKDGRLYFAAEIEGCSGPDSEGPLRMMNPLYFSLQLTDNTRLQVSLDGTTRRTLPNLDVLSVAPLLPNDCVRGWIVFVIPEGKRPKSLIFSPGLGSNWLEKWVLDAPLPRT